MLVRYESNLCVILNMKLTLRCLLRRFRKSRTFLGRLKYQKGYEWRMVDEYRVWALFERGVGRLSDGFTIVAVRSNDSL